MRPIGQTFYLSAPLSGNPGYFITKVGVFFKQISSVAVNAAIEIQIRTTENGVITPYMVADYATKTLRPSDLDGSSKPILKASNDASVETIFEFDTPVWVESNKSYGFVLSPPSGSPDYLVWTAVIGDTDATTGKAIDSNSESGDLFLSSNDRVWTPVINEDIKYNLYCARFTATSGTAVFHSPDEDFLEIKNETGNFTGGEPIYVTNGKVNTFVLGVNSVLGSFNNSDTVYQTNNGLPSGTNTAVGLVYAANSTYIRLNLSNGAFTNTANVFNANSTSNAYVYSVNSSVITSGSNTVIVPDTSRYSLGDAIYISSNNGANTQIVNVTAVNANTLGVNNAVTFSDAACIIGKLRGNGGLRGGYSSEVDLHDRDFKRIILDFVTSNASTSFANSIGEKIIGYYSQQSAEIVRCYDPAYNQLSGSFLNHIPANTNIDWSFKGFKHDASYTPDGSFFPMKNETSNELRDFERVSMSRSNELTNLPLYRQGNSSVVFNASMTTANNFFSPYIDSQDFSVTYTYNLCVPESQLTGYYLTIKNANGVFKIGDNVSQGGVTGTIFNVNRYNIIVNNVANGSFTNTAITNSTTSATANVVTAEYFNESIDSNYYASSRYVSKQVVLSDGQDSEDIMLYMGAYRPANTNLNVYVKVQNKNDPDAFTDKSWTKLIETTPASLQSSTADTRDLVELVYTFPLSQNISQNGVSVSSSSNNITFNTFGLSNNDYVYIGDNTSANGFCIRKCTGANSTVVQLDTAPPFTSANCTFGYIPGMNVPTAVFLYDRNNNVSRYVTASGVVYDSYITYSTKVVPVADSTAIVPKVADLRIVNLQV